MHRWIIPLLIILLGSCRPETPDASSEDLRLISLSPALTGIIEDAGLGDSLVGRSSWCVLQNRDQAEVPAVGDLHERDWEAIIRLQPSHVFIQADSVEQDASLLDLSREYGWSLHAWPLRGVEDIKVVLHELPIIVENHASSRYVSTAGRCQSLLDRLDESLIPSRIGENQRILIVNDQIPPLAWGRGTYLDRMLDATAATNVIQREGWQQLSMEDVVRLKPDRVLVVTTFSKIDPPALARLEDGLVPEDRCHWLAHPRINYPGPHLAEAFLAMRAILSGH
ncbi:MAG: hypothetical protein CMJ40_08580 [Phycisphaerae bacterium]|nr:hypothetical protein [Phycisphaerae bacterium]|tara:strand:+ start:1887 stop:2729 length:843 start_codon:yes stop_codon:yes gene_type:complete